MAKVLGLPLVQESEVVFTLVAKRGTTKHAAEELTTFFQSHEEFGPEVEFDKALGLWKPKASNTNIPMFRGRVVLGSNSVTFFGPTFAPVALLMDR